MEETFHSAKEGIKSSLYESLMKEGISSLREEFHRIIDNTRSELFQDNLDDAPSLEFQENNQKDYVNFDFENDNNNNNLIYIIEIKNFLVGTIIMGIIMKIYLMILDIIIIYLIIFGIIIIAIMNLIILQR
jgi:hypothetical protein